MGGVGRGHGDGEQVGEDGGGKGEGGRVKVEKMEVGKEGMQWRQGGSGEWRR